MKKHIKESDKQKLVEFVNFIAEKGKFDNMNVKEVIKFYGLLSFIQKELLPKIEDNIFEIGQPVQQKLPDLPKDE